MVYSQEGVTTNSKASYFSTRATRAPKKLCQFDTEAEVFEILVRPAGIEPATLSLEG
jgi:hypothetical protein